MAAFSPAIMLSFLQWVTYNRHHLLRSYVYATHGAVSEVLGAKFAGKPVLLFVCTASQRAFPDADGNGSCG